MPVLLPDYVREVLNRLEQAGFSAYCVGGCVRDSLRGVIPNDYDLACSALPEETMAVFSDHTVIPTGLAHGTVTLLAEGHPLEITTFRTDGSYTDRRRPDKVSFCGSIREDLARRDFTINAMAYRPGEGLVDLFGGREDLENRLIRCVGEPALRFSEDALRILRALRFASGLDFSIEPRTGQAARELAPTLEAVAVERRNQELEKLLCGPGVCRVLREFPQVLEQLFPGEYRPLLCRDNGFLDRVPPDFSQRLALLCSRFSPEEAEELLRGWKLDNRTRQRVTGILAQKRRSLPQTLPDARRWLNQEKEETVRMFLAHEQALAQTEERRSALAKAQELVKNASGTCCRLEQLAVTGRQLRPVGVPPGKEMGNMLRRLLEEVMEGRLENQRDPLLDRARVLWEGRSAEKKEEREDSFFGISMEKGGE